MLATGDGPDVYGFIASPQYKITDKLDVVGRYKYAHGDDDSLRLERRYGRFVDGLTDGGRGSEIHLLYGGLNYYINDHKFKVMAGVKWDQLTDEAGDGGDYDGWSFLTAIRFYF